MFHLRERLGAGSYMLWSSLLFIAWAMLVSISCELIAKPRLLQLTEFKLLVSSFGACLGIAFYALSARRLKDLNMPPWLVKVLAFPILALILTPYLFLVSGPRGENQYGPAQPSSSLGKIACAVALLFLAVNLSFAAVVYYYKARNALGG
jgi:uncharacterized membrane protein YhaH (DUF805 family)